MEDVQQREKKKKEERKEEKSNVNRVQPTDFLITFLAVGLGNMSFSKPEMCALSH